MAKPVKLLIVDDSPIFVDSFRRLLSADRLIEVVDTASHGQEAVEKTVRCQPDIVTMDMHMPGMGGLEAIEHIMSTRPTPIMIVTGDPGYLEGQRCFEALSRGALELLVKPDLDRLAKAEVTALCERIRFLAHVPVVHHAQRHHHGPGSGPGAEGADTQPGLIGVVASTGGPSLLGDILHGLPRSFPVAVVVVQHLATGFAPHFVEWLSSCGAIGASIARDGERVEPGHLYLAPDDGHLLVQRGGRLRIDRETPPLNGHCPSGDLLLRSIARAHGARGAGVVLTGMGRDGVDGLGAIYAEGGVTIAQDAETSIVDGMPKAARDAGVVDRVVARPRLADALLEVARMLSARATRRPAR